MQNSSLTTLWHHSKRSNEILSTIIKYGLGEWMSHSPLEIGKELVDGDSGLKISQMSTPERLRHCLIDLGTTFIKIGQILSTRPDLVGYAIAEELKSLQDNVPEEALDDIYLTLRENLGDEWQGQFLNFDEKPVASASIGQVHLATLKQGEQKVAVKVQRRGIKKQVYEDLEILATLAKIVDKTNKFKFFEPSSTIAEMSRVLKNELDYKREQQNMVLITKDFVDNEKIKIPKTWPQLSGEKVLVMEFIDGIRPNDREALAKIDSDLREVALTGGKAFFEMIFANGRFHADPHPGNFLILENNVIGLLDYGMLGHLNEQLREDFEDFLIAIIENNSELLATAIFRIGNKTEEIDLDRLDADLSDFLNKYSNVSFEHFDLSAILREMINILVKNRIVLKPQVGLVLKVLIMLEGTAQILDPKFSAVDLVLPTIKKFQAVKWNPEKQSYALFRYLRSAERAIRPLPDQLVAIISQFQKGNLKGNINHIGLNSAINRLMAGMLFSALFLGSTQLLVEKVPPLVFSKPTVFGLRDVSLLGIAGYVIAIAGGLLTLISAGKAKKDGD